MTAAAAIGTRDGSGAVQKLWSRAFWRLLPGAESSDRLLPGTRLAAVEREEVLEFAGNKFTHLHRSRRIKS